MMIRTRIYLFQTCAPRLAADMRGVWWCGGVAVVRYSVPCIWWHVGMLENVRFEGLGMDIYASYL